MILPGQGAIGSWFSAYNERRIGEAVQAALSDRPCLGICIGLQALFDRSDEDGGVEGLGLFPGPVRHFREIPSTRVKAEGPGTWDGTGSSRRMITLCGAG